MASEVDICALALSHIGDTASISSINPPGSSIQAQHCARFYPVARDACLSMDWGFNTQRGLLTPASLPAGVTQWQQAYQKPSNCLKILAILDPNSSDDTTSAVVTPLLTPSSIPPWYSLMPDPGMYEPQPFIVERNPADGTPIIYTNQQNAFARYTVLMTDTSQFSPLFVLATSYLLASFLAGPIIKGDEGIKVGASMLQMYEKVVAQAAQADGSERQSGAQQSPDWIASR